MQLHIARHQHALVGPDFEFVERKGIGHPDTICDAIAEAASRKYSQHCLSLYGGVAHHWFDKTLLIGGESLIDWGVGELTRPYTVVFHGKITKIVGNEPIPYQEILKSAAVEVLKNSLIGFDKHRHVTFDYRLVDYQGAGRSDSRYRPTSGAQLARLDDWKQFVSNDCNLISAYWPLSKAETLALQLESFVNSGDFKQLHPYTGTDVKIFVTRMVAAYSVTLNIPFLSKQLESPQAYENCKKGVESELRAAIAKIAPSESVELQVNPQDRTGRPYLTALGSAADTGDVGVVGRGNRGNGLITPMRAMSIEAPAGKNPTDHTGKIYTQFALSLAKRLHTELQQAVEVHIFTAKESRLDDPDSIVVSCSEISAEVDRKIRATTVEALSSVGDVIESFVTNPGVVLW